jgi:hypothetical protein
MDTHRNTSTEPRYTTERDVALDLVAALDMYSGLMGSESTSIELVGPSHRDDALVIQLDNGDTYELRVSLLMTGPRECEGHPAGPSDPMGVTVYCDGTCRA